jgi:hypothetical protein
VDRYNRNWTIVLASLLAVGLGTVFAIRLYRDWSGPPTTAVPSPSVTTAVTASPS